VALTVVAGACLPLSTAAAASIVTAPGTNIGNAGPLSGSPSFIVTGAGDMTSMSDDWFVLYLSAPGVAPNITIDNTSAPGLCGIQAQLYTAEGTGQRVLQQFIIPSDIVTLTDPLTGLKSDRYFVELNQWNCGPSATDTTTTPYTISVPIGTATGWPTARNGFVTGAATSASAWPPLQGSVYYSGTLGSQSWYQLDKKADSAPATLRLEDTTVLADASLACPGLQATLYAGTGTGSLTQVSSTGLFGNEATTIDIPGRLSGDPAGQYYLKLAATGCDLLNTTTYVIELEPASEWGTVSQQLPSGPTRTAAAGPLPGGVSYQATLLPGLYRWAYFRATSAVTVRLYVPFGPSCMASAGVDNTAGAKVAAATPGQGHVTGMRVAKAGTYYLFLFGAGKCKVNVLVRLAGGVRGPVLHVLNPTLRAGLVHHAYRCLIGVAGGKQPYTFTALTPLPTGLRLSRTTGWVTGTPAARGTFTFMVTVADATKPVPDVSTTPITIVVT
jgi:hypothetical protein